MTQKSIELIQDCVKVCNYFFHFNIRWDIEVMKQQTGLSEDRIYYCLEQTNKQKYTWKVGSKHGLTYEGREFVEGLEKSSEINTATSTAKHKEEALLGLVEKRSRASGYLVSEKSKMTKAILPTYSEPRETKTPEDFFIEQDREKKGRERIAKSIGITVKQLEDAYEKGLVAICPGCEKIELFHSHGKYRQDKCIKCKKKRRK